MIFRTPFFLPFLYPGLTWKIDTNEKEIFLTFDDGPVPGPTEFVLDTLKKFNARATFFCIGDNIRKHPAIFKQIVDQGHAIGNHTFNHLKGWNFSVDDYVANIKQCGEEIEAKGVKIAPENQLFRPPYGRIKRSQIRSLRNYKIIMWDVLTHDYAKEISPERCLKGSLKASRNGSIVVFHDSLKAEKNLRYVLPAFLEYFASRNYIFKALTNL